MDEIAYPYRTEIEWQTRRRAALRSEDLPPLQVSTPPEFKGEAGYWTPEHLFVAAVESCLMGTFIGVAEKSGVPVSGYHSSATGTMKTTPASGLQFTEIEITVTVELENEEIAARAQRVMDRATAACPVAKSVAAEVKVNSRFVVKQKDMEQKELASPSRR